MQSRYIKGKNNETINRRLETTIAKLYCVSLPFRMISQLSFLKDVVGGCANYIPFVFHLFGLLLWLNNENGKLNFEKKDLVGNTFKLMLWLNCSSVVMAFVIQSIYGNHGSENAFQGIVGMLIYFLHYMLIFIYNFRVFQLLSRQEINKILHIDCIALLTLGYIQVLVMNGVGAGLYDRINIFGIVNPSSMLAKLSLTGNEGATAGCIIGVFVVPFLLSQIIIGKRRYFIEVLLWLIPLYFTYSSTAYILFATDVGVFLFFLILKSDRPIQGFITLIIIILCVGIIWSSLIQTGILNEDQINDMSYLLFIKASDDKNGSTIARTIPLLVNWGAFTEYPFFGVGNGLQGYFYEKYFPNNALYAAGSDAVVFLKRSREVISNGGIFIPSLLSGYGIVGCLFILVFVWKCIKNNKLNKRANNNFYYLYIIAGIAFIVMGFQGDVYGLYFAWFVISIPFMTLKEDYTT